ncbi:MAG: class I tRNA ligase family protein, partial [Clostridia bacterium]|nr:class I tRNA ligase family protein [Clostridia bacterium]
WSTAGVRGCRRFLERVWSLQDSIVEGDGVRAEVEKSIHKTIRKVSDDTECLKYNTAIAAMMALINDFQAAGGVTREEYRLFLLLLNPFVPHITEEIWQNMGYEGMLHQATWPEYDPAKCVDATVEIAIQVNGKLRGRIAIPADAAQDDVLALVKQEEKIAAEIAGKTIVRELYISGKLVNIVCK